MTKPYIPGELQIKQAAFERLQIVGIIMQNPGITAREISQKMKRSYAATQCQLKRLIENNEIRSVSESCRSETNQPRRRNHFFLPTEGDVPNEVKEATIFDMPRQSTVTKWVRDTPKPWDLMAIFYKMVIA